jgi:hypothetical protein
LGVQLELQQLFKNTNLTDLSARVIDARLAQFDLDELHELWDRLSADTVETT